MLKKIVGGLDAKNIGLCVFLDLQKAFDLVDHSILLRKLNYYGIRGISNKLLGSFLADRKQYVYLNNTSSTVRSVHLGVPQGSILSPLLFIIFINDIVNSSSILHFNLFADDTSLYLESNNMNDLYMTMNLELENVSNWILANKLSINVEKTVYLLFTRKKTLPHTPELLLFNKTIVRKSETKFLGIIIDDRLNWQSHAHFISGKIARMIGILHKISSLLTLPTLKIIYNSLIYPHLQYGIVFWNNVNKTKFNYIFRLQKKAIRLINKSGKFDHTEPLFKNNKILNLNDIMQMELCKFVHHDINVANHFNFRPRSDLHSYHTRYASDIQVPSVHTELARKFVSYKGVSLFNSLSDDIRSIPDKIHFKCKVKNYLLSMYTD